MGVYGYPHVLYGLLRSGSIIRKYKSEQTVIVVVIIKMIPVYRTTCLNVEVSIKTKLMTSWAVKALNGIPFLFIFDKNDNWS